MATERGLSELADDNFSPTYLRNATGQVRLQSDGTPWRPLVHIEDISRAFLSMLEAPRELVHDQAFNVGRPEENVQIRDIAEMVRDAVPGSEVSLADGAGQTCATTLRAHESRGVPADSGALGAPELMTWQ